MLSKKLFAITILLISVGAFIFGIHLTFFSNKGLKKTDALITRIDEIYLGHDEDGDDYDYEVYVQYKEKRKKYIDARLDTFEGSYKEGKTIKIYYDPADPSVPHGETKGMGIYLMIAGPVIFLIGLFILLKSSR